MRIYIRFMRKTPNYYTVQVREGLKKFVKKYFNFVLLNI